LRSHPTSSAGTRPGRRRGRELGDGGSRTRPSRSASSDDLEVVGDGSPVDRAVSARGALAAASVHAEVLFEMRDTGLTSRTPGAASAESTLSLVGNTVFGLMARLWSGDGPHAQLREARFTLGRVEATIGCNEVWRATKGHDVMLRRWNEKRRVGLVGHLADIGDEAALGILDLHQHAELRRLVWLSAA